MSMKDKILSATGIAQALSALGASSEETKKAADMLTDLEIGKAVGQPLTSSEHVKDRWESGNMHTAPSKEEIRIGPVEFASGGGAEKQIRDYSNPAPQDGTQTVPLRVAAELGQLRGYARATGEAIDRLVKGQETLTGVLTSLVAKQAAEEDGEDGEASRFGDWHARKAEEFLRATKSVIAKAGQLFDSLDDLQPEQRKATKNQIRDLKKRAARLGLSALAASYAAKSADADPAAEVRKTIRSMMEDDRVLKADISALHDKDKEKDEEKRAKKAMKRAAKKAAEKLARKAAKKAAAAAQAEAVKTDPAKAIDPAAAKGEDKGNQADKQDPDSKNQDDSAKKAEVDKDALTKALEGFGMLQGTISQVLDIVSGKPTSLKASEPLALMKGDPGTTFLALDSRISEALAGGTLDTSGESRARDMLQKLDAVRKGVMSESMWQDMYKQAPRSVQEIFREAA